MHGWLGVVEVLGVLIALLAISLLMLAGRRRWIDRLGGTFDCSLRLRMTTPGAGWVLGVARYSEGILEWFRFFSYSLRPRMAFPRRNGRAETEWELAMSEESLTGLLSWLEAAPPGVRRFE